MPAHLDGDPKNWLLRKDGSAAGATYQPMLAASADVSTVGEGWIYEPKWDSFGRS